MKSSEYLDNLFSHIDSMEEDLRKISQSIWENPELGGEEYFACEVLMKKLEESGFDTEKGIANMETAFIGTYKSDKKGPKIALVAEYDALLGLGHACGHNLFCCSAVGAAIALKGYADKYGGEIVVLGSPAEEGGIKYKGGKVYLIREGYFKDVDCAFTFHGENETVIERRLVTTINITATFKGLSAHAGGSPEKGVNALTAGILALSNINGMRQHDLPGDRVNGIMIEGGTLANTIPDKCKLEFSVRSKTKNNLQKVIDMVKRCVEAGALVTGCQYEIQMPDVVYDDTLSSHEMGLVMAEVLDKLQVSYKQYDERSYGWDAGNISYVCPILASYIAIGPESLIGHTDAFREASNSDKGYEGMLIGAKSMAAVALEYLVNEDFRNRVQEEFEHTAR